MKGSRPTRIILMDLKFEYLVVKERKTNFSAIFARLQNIIPGQYWYRSISK